MRRLWTRDKDEHEGQCPMLCVGTEGANALPFLLAKLEGWDSAGERVVTKAAQGTGVRELPFRNADLGFPILFPKS